MCLISVCTAMFHEFDQCLYCHVFVLSYFMSLINVCTAMFHVFDQFLYRHVSRV